MSKFSKYFSTIKRHPVVIAFVLLCASVPLICKNSYIQRVFVEVFFYAAMGSAWNILGGFGKQTSWASPAFFCIGAYSAILMDKNFGVSPWISMVLGAGLAAVLALIIGAPTLKLRGVFFSIATISCTSIVRQLLFNTPKLTGGAQGLILKMSSGNNFWHLRFDSEIPFFYIALAWMLAVIFIVSRFSQSKIGWYLRTIREDEDAAQTLGIKTYDVKLKAFLLSAMLLAVTGAFYSFKIGYIDPNSSASHDLAVRIAVTAILGGMGTIWGPVLGAFICIPILEVSNYYLSDLGGGGAGFALYGLAMILIVLLRPNGIISLFTFKKKDGTVKAGENNG